LFFQTPEHEFSDVVSDLSETMTNISLHSLGPRERSSTRSTVQVNYGEEKLEEYFQAPRPPRLANSRNPPGHRNPARDQYYTPERALIPIMKHLRPLLDKITVNKTLPILEPFAGEGHISRYLRSQGYKVIEQDLYTDYVDIKIDYLASEDPSDVVFTFSNPAYCIKFEVLRKAFLSKKPFAFLLPARIIFTVQGRELFRQYPVAIFAFARDVKFIRPDGSTTAFSGMAWFCGNFEKVKDYIELRYLDDDAVGDEDEVFSIVGQDSDEL
jgi:hypothetical protein